MPEQHTKGYEHDCARKENEHLTPRICTPIVRHSLTIGVVFLWLNLQLMKNTNRSTLFERK